MISIEIKSGPSCLLKSARVVLTLVRVVFWSVPSGFKGGPSCLKTVRVIFGPSCAVLSFFYVAYNIDKF